MKYAYLDNDGGGVTHYIRYDSEDKEFHEEILDTVKFMLNDGDTKIEIRIRDLDETCEVSWVEEKGQWELVDQLDGNEDEFYYLDLPKDEPVENVVRVVLDTTYLHPWQITVYDHNKGKDGYAPITHYDKDGKLKE